MDTKEIKIGEKYKLELLCIYNAGKVITFETPTGDHLPFRERDLECVSPAAPKYDPCREFRKGDKVKAVHRYGRIPNNGVPKDVILEVIEDERDGIVKVLHKMGAFLEIFNVYALFLELVTPVEELEPYSVREYEKVYEVQRGTLTFSVFCKMKYGATAAKERAEAERDRLNAEYRKEMEK